jgi:hypothetical protein
MRAWLSCLFLGLAAAEGPPTKFRPPTAAEVFEPKGPVIFADDFQAPRFSPKWRFSENANYEVTTPDPELIRLVDAPGLSGKKAVRFSVVRAPNVFRSELSLPHEPGWKERWYAGRILIPQEWVIDPGKPADIVMQWHAIPGNFRPTHPNLALAVVNDRWVIRQHFGDPKTKSESRETVPAEPVRPGAWVAWVIHARWSPKADGLIQVWKDGQLVADLKGPNTYGTIGVEYTPYLKTGIYHPEWHLDKPENKVRFEADNPVATRKIIYVTDVKVGDARASREDVEPR